MRPTGALVGLVAVVAVCSTACSKATSAGSHSVPTHTAPSVTGSSTARTPDVRLSDVRLRARQVAVLPDGVSRTVAVRRGPRIIILGGLAAGDVTTSRVVSLDLATRRASTVGSLREAVHDASGALLNGRAVVFGGGAAQEVSDVQAWTSGTSGVVGRLSSGRSDSASAVLDGAAYVVGGFDGTGMTRGILATNDGRHFRVAGHLKVGVRYPAVAAAAGAIWVVGGQLATTASTAAGGQSDAIQRFDPGTGRTTVVGHLPKTLGHAMAFVLGGQLFLAGGRHGTTATARIWRMDERTGQVTAAGRLPFAFSDAAAVIVGDQAWLIGGETSGPTAPLRTVVAVGYRGIGP